MFQGDVSDRQTKEELEACFRLLHDAYVRRGYMKPDPSGMRVTIYHALPTTTTLCALFDGKVVGTISLIRESAIGFPLQRIFDLTSVRAKRGNIAEVSALVGFQHQCNFSTAFKARYGLSPLALRQQRKRTH